ncbi:MAG: M48 family metallopeptidase [Bdellovibrionaceae bacterium]|nr:M48 family metallopeptidase [Pseudobdellovibrionaceae bacterium]
MSKTQQSVCLGLILSCLLFACASTTEQGAVGVDRRQMLLVPNEQIIRASLAGYDQTKREASDKGVLDKNPDQVRRVQEILRRLIPPTTIFRSEAKDWPWEAHVISSPELNAYCMPGGKIIFYSGIIEKLALTDDEIAAIMGHEIAHALREHGRERMSEELIKQIGLQLLVETGTMDAKYMSAANLVTTLSVTLRHGRRQESEADEIGLELAARAGYNPRGAVSLWKKMGQTSGGSGMPEFLSTHPASDRRSAELEGLLPKVMPFYKGQPRN